MDAVSAGKRQMTEVEMDESSRNDLLSITDTTRSTEISGTLHRTGFFQHVAIAFSRYDRQTSVFLFSKTNSMYRVKTDIEFIRLSSAFVPVVKNLGPTPWRSKRPSLASTPVSAWSVYRTFTALILIYPILCLVRRSTNSIRNTSISSCT